MQAEIYDKVHVETNGGKYEGTLMPSQTDRIVLKLKNGYNIGLKKESAIITLLEKKEEKSQGMKMFPLKKKKVKASQHFNSFNRGHHSKQDRLPHGSCYFTIFSRRHP